MEDEFKDIIVKYPDTESSKNNYAIRVQSIVDFFKENRVHKIPSYQRPYSWEEKQVKQLLDDIENSIEGKRKWFLGPLFTSQEKFDEKSIDILDGQQRLTTIILILRAIYICEYLVDESVFSGQVFSTETGNESPKEKMIEALARFRNIQNMILKCLIFDDEIEPLTFKKVPKFITSNATMDILSDFLIQTENVNRDNIKRYRTLAFSQSHKYAPTYVSINQNIEVIYKRLTKTLKGKDGIIKINDIAFQILYRLFFIQIPLQSKSDVLDIFETINNRGKRLTLSDLIRFRTLKFSDENVSSEIQEKWSEIFQISGKLSNSKTKNKFFTDLDVFLERFINSISTGDGLTDNSSRLEYFTEFYGGNFLQGVNDILNVLRGWEYIFDVGNDGYTSAFNKKENIKSLIVLLRIALNYSKNSQIMFISYLRNKFPYTTITQNHNTGATSYDLLEIFKTIFSVSLFHNTKSNLARGIFIEIAGSYNDPRNHNKLTYKNFHLEGTVGNSSNFPLAKKISFKSKSGLQNILFTKRSDQDATSLILGIYEIMNDGKLPHPDDYDNNNIDHIMPEKWYSNGGWVSDNSSDKLESAISKTNNEQIKNVLEEFMEIEDFYSETKYANSFLQLIGNKFQIISKTNKVKSNNYWLDHPDNTRAGGAKDYLKLTFLDDPTSNFCIPTKPKPPYQYELFAIKDIIERSEEIASFIIERFDDFVVKIN